MKRTHKITIIAMLVCLIAFCITLASCSLEDLFNFHSHTYEDMWCKDQTYHWKQCTVCDKQVNKQMHVVEPDGWIVFEEPTETQTGLRRGRCVVCQIVVEEDIPKLDHEHNFTGNYSSDEYGHWQTCSCGQRGEFSEHAVTNWTVDVEATETTQGQKRGVCSVCNANVTQAIPVIGHTHNYSANLQHDDTYHYRECSCGERTEVALHAYSDEWEKDATKHWQQCECGSIANEQAHITTWVVDEPATTTSTGSKHEECTVCKKEFGSQVIDKLTSTTRTVDFYAINDFHGEVDKISSVGGYLKEQKNKGNTVLLNSGDMFQGSMESNSNYGKLLTDCMDAIGFDAFAFGNHEFDWGLNKLEQLASNSNVPFLGANIYHWNASSKTWGTFASELAQKYTIVTLDNGLKVGIIGVIGENQITSISSNLVQTIGFKDPMPIIKELATELRNEQQCDVVVVTAHASPRGLVGESEGNNDPEEPSSAYGLEDYVDAVFCAHTHREQNFLVDGLPFIQGASYGSKVSHISLTVNANGKVNYSARENISYSKSWSNVLVIDNLIDNSNAQIADERNQVLIPNLGSSLNANPAMARLVSRSIAEYAKNQGYDISLAMVNTARKTLYSGQVTYSELYESIPFDNVVYIAKVKGSDIISEVNYGNYYWRSSGEAIESAKYYYIAVIDYLLFHQNSYRNYNYFPSAFSSGFTPVALTNDNYEVYNYRLITRDYLLSNSINASDYIYNNNNTDTSLLQEAVTLTYETTGNWNGSGGTTPTPNPTPSAPTHAGTLADPYDIADALLLGADYDNGSQAPKIYVKATVSDVSTIRTSRFSDDIGGFYVSDENGNSIYVYYVSKSSNSDKNWSSTDELKVGDVLVIYIASYVYSYNGTTPQLGYGYCVSINGVATN